IENGLDFTAYPGDVHDRYSVFAPFEQGRSRRSNNCLSGQRGELKWEIFDYRYVTGNGKNQTTHHWGIVAAWSRVVSQPMEIGPENFFDKIAAAGGFDDIDFESEEFSKAFYVKCANRKFAYDVIDPQMMEFLLKAPKLSWQFAGPIVL